MEQKETNSDHSAGSMVSVIMVAYNAEKYIAEAIEGVVRQKFRFDVELLVMDDCSTDSTGEIVRRLSQYYPQIRYIRNETNLGSQGNYLKGFRMARGKYMALCDADDYWCSRRKLARQVDYMEKHPQCALTFHRVVNYYESSGEKTLSNGQHTSQYTAESLSRSNYITNLSVMYRRALVDLDHLPAWIMQHRSPDYAIHMLYAAKGSIHYFPQPMGVYRKVEGAIWSTAGEYRRQKMALEMRRSLMEEFSQRPGIVEGLRQASQAIVLAMLRCASTPEEQAEVESYAREFNIDTSANVCKSRNSTRPSRGILSRIVRRISRLIPRPRP